MTFFNINLHLFPNSAIPQRNQQKHDSIGAAALFVSRRRGHVRQPPKTPHQLLFELHAVRLQTPKSLTGCFPNDWHRPEKSLDPFLPHPPRLHPLQTGNNAAAPTGVALFEFALFRSSGHAHPIFLAACRL